MIKLVQNVLTKLLLFAKVLKMISLKMILTDPTMLERIVQIFSFLKRTSVYKARKNSNKNKIHLDIAKKRLSLLDEAKKHMEKDSTVVFVFADVNCNTVAKMKSGLYAFFDDLYKLNSVDSYIVQDSEHDQPERSCKYLRMSGF